MFRLRRKILLGIFAIPLGISLIPWNTCLSGEKPTIVLIVRHAEKSASTGDIPLSQAGFERAQVLARVLADANLSAIYTGKSIRTVQTAEPFAKRLNLVPQVIDEVETLAKNILEHHAGQTVLVVHHSQTVPKIIKTLGADTKPVIADDEFDKLFVVTLGLAVPRLEGLALGAGHRSSRDVMPGTVGAFAFFGRGRF